MVVLSLKLSFKSHKNIKLQLKKNIFCPSGHAVRSRVTSNFAFFMTMYTMVFFVLFFYKTDIQYFST
jgi:hypothetical protein